MLDLAYSILWMQNHKTHGKMNMNKKANHTVGSGNVFKDLGFDRPDEELAKSDLAIQISKIIQQKGWTQKKAAGVLGIDQPKVSALKNGRLGGFSIERLLSFLRALDRDIDIVVRPKIDDVAHIQVAETINRPKYVTR